MSRRTWVLVAVLAAAMAWALVVPLGASAIHTNAECALCHGEDSLVNDARFRVGPVNRETACQKCHLDSLVGTHPNHYATGNCSAMCHPGWGASLAAHIPTYLDSAGAFASADSKLLPSFVLHAIHSNPRWPAGVSTENSKCGSCHATAACTACHNGTPAPDATHANHGDVPTSTPIVPWVGDVSIGVTAAQGEDTMLSDYPVTCGAVGCHDTNAVRTSSPDYMDVYSVANAELRFITPALSASGTWSFLTGTVHTMQRERNSNAPGAQLTWTFSGERVSIYGTKDQYRGVGEVLINGSSVATFTAYNGTTQRQRPLWTSADLGPGTHTVTVRVTGTKEPLSRGTFVSVDHIAIYGDVTDTAVPDCASCHPPQGDDGHGGEHPVDLTFSHDLTQTISASNTWNTGYGTYSCNQCHQSSMRLEHRRPTNANVGTFPDSCSVCHPHSNPGTEATLITLRTPYPTVWTGTYDVANGCSDPEFNTYCHSVSSSPVARPVHNLVVPSHAANASGQSPACSGCHGTDLRAVHNNSIPGNGKVDTNGCLVCHTPAKLETNRTCSQGPTSCHSGGYAAIDTHAIKDAGSHLASDTGKPFTRAYQASAGTDDGGVECALCHSSQLIPAHADSPAVGCATGGAGGLGCHMDTAYNSIAVASSGWTSRKCADCHDYSAQQSHDSTMTPHLVANNGCAGTGSGCHNSNDLWQLHLASQGGTPRPDKGCNVIGCHDTLDRRPTKNYANSCGSTSPSGCHASYTSSHTSTFSHSFSSVSYYNGATETGCTNQTGCHNAGANSTADFGDDHHPVTGASCFGGTCHNSPSKAAFTGILPTDCQECHRSSGGFTGAAARTNLTAAPASGGHYSETTHTAVGMTTPINAGGSASATCTNCHAPTVGGSSNGLKNQHSSITIAGSPYGSALACGECHGDTRSFGYAQVVANWTNNTCADCHSALSSSPHDHAATPVAVAEVGSTCGSTGSGCHNSTDLHALHKDAAGCNLTGCHNYAIQAHRPTAKGCGGATSCHTGYTNTSHGAGITGNEATHTAAAMTTVLDATYNAGGANTCADCHSAGLEAAHAPAITGNLGWTAPTCLSCHNSTTPVNSVNVVKTTGWPAKSCEECHGAPNGPAKHTEYTTGHTGAEASGCTWSAACHGNTRDLRALHNNSVTSNGSTAGCDAAGCHDAVNKEMQSASKTCGSGGTGCHQDKTHDNHGAASAHGYTAVSDYTQTTSETVGGESGCAGSGAGCHGTIGTRNGVDEFHSTRTAGCTATDICHGNAAFNQSFRDAGSGTDCVRCHDSTAFGPTVDDMPLSGLTPAGHYPGALHTATSGLTTVTAGGTAGAPCSSCHSLSLKDAHGAARTGFSSTTKGTYVTCQECHEYNINVISQVKTANWSTNACADCHAVGVLGASRVQHGNAPVVAEVTTTCGSTGINCHNSTDLHALHKDAAGGCNLTGCHVYTTQAALPTLKSCGTGGACHTAYTKNSHLHNGDAAKHQPTALTQANATTYYGTACGSCHDIRNSNSSLTLEHSLSTSAKSTNPTNVCMNCHNNAAATTAVGNSWSAKDTTSACSACHTGGLAIHADANSAAHTTANAGCASTGIGCHNSADLSSVGTTATAANTVIHNSCLRCHSRTGSASWSTAMIGTAGNMAYNPTVKTCGGATGCHTSASYSPASGFHRIGRGDVVNGNDAKHTDTVMTGTMTSGVASATCANCHSGQLNTAHATALTGWANTCTGCHNSTISGSVAANQVKGNWTTDDCGDCHTTGASAVKIPNMHSRYAAGTHDGTSPLGCGASGTNCHTTYDLAVLHGKTLTNGCQVTGCHDAVNKVMTSAPKSCGVGGTCHNTYTMDTHTHLLGGGDAAKHQPTTLTQANATQFSVACGSCHDIRTSGSSLTLEHSLSTSAKSTNATNVCRNCHNNAAATTAVGNSWSAKDTTSACAACHTGGLAIHANENVTAHSTEANAGCAASGVGCHNGTDLSRVGVVNAINTNIHTSCLRCHDRAGAASWTSAMIGTATNVRYAPGEKRCGQASGCHTSDLYSPASGFHRIGRGDVVNGNDAKHVATGMTGTVGTAAKNTCADCHSAGLTNSHPTAMTGWTNTCTSCHNSALATNVSPTQVKVGWTSDLCTDCHTSGASAVKIPNMHSRYSTNHLGVPIAGNTCDPACHPTMTTLELGDIHSERPNGCQITGCHALNTQMPTAVSARSCGGTNSCHNGYLDGNHGFNAAKHQTTDENSWKNCGRCHLAYRADYTRTGTFNTTPSIDAESPSGPDQLHRNATNGGVGCNTCHDSGSRVFDPKGTKTANCSQCHVDHYGHTDNKTPYTTTSTSNTNLAKTLTLNFTGMATADVFFDLATTDNAVTANARLEIGTLGSPFYTQTVNTTAMDPNRKKFEFRNIPVAGLTGNQPVRLYVWKGAGTATIINDVFDASVARGNLETLHTADVSGFTCSFGDCHSANIIAEHDKYEIPGAFTGNYVWPTNPTRENLSTVQGGTTAGTFYKVKSLTLNLDEIDKMRVRLNLYCADSTARTLSFRVQIGAAVIASGSYSTTSVQRWWDYSQGGTDPAGVALNYLDTTAYSGTQVVDLYISSNRGTTTGAARNNTFQIWAGEREYAASTPTDPCDVCHLNTGRVDVHGAPDPGDLSLTASTPKLAGIGAQCDTCHPNWAVGHPQFGHRASKTSDTCILGCHQYKPAIDGTALVDPYDLTQKHNWGDSTGAGMTYTPGTVLGTETFGTTTTWPGTWTRSDATYVTNQTGSAQGGTGAAPQIGVNTTRTEYNFYRTAAFNTQNYSGGGLFRFWYQVNVGDTSDFLVAEYSTVSAAGPYTELWRRNTDALTWTQTPWLNVPRSSNVWIRFRGTFNTTGEYGRVDTLEMNGSNRTFSGTMEGGCATGATGACHNQGFPTRGECQDCHTSVNHHNTVHDLSVGGTRTEVLLTGFSFDSCVGTCHSKNLHWNHGVGLSETEPRPYRAPGMASDGIMTCATCHASANTTIKNLANDASTPIASRTLTCGQCHTGTAGMASLGHAGVSTSWRTGQPLRGANVATEFSNTTSVSGHRSGSYTNVFDPDSGTAGQQRWWDATRWYMASGAGRTQFNFNNFTAAPGQTNAAGLLRATIVGPDGTAGTAIPLKAGGTALTTTMNVHCSDCHGESTASLEGPQGAATNISMLDGFTTRWVDQTNNLIVNNTLICNRCHDINLGTATASAHRSNSGHVGSGRTNRCIACHVAIPHAWKRPKLLVNYTRDAGTPYVINPGTATGSSLRGWTAGTGGNASATFNSSGNCASTGCRSHSGADTVP
ncbi:MAG: cytochrome c3 family protein [Coriobacteriia bacterium]|nr:cytochrome c3 family protein [Coriobacteriia bacterium]